MSGKKRKCLVYSLEVAHNMYLYIRKTFGGTVSSLMIKLFYQFEWKHLKMKTLSCTLFEIDNNMWHILTSLTISKLNICYTVLFYNVTMYYQCDNLT